MYDSNWLSNNKKEKKMNTKKSIGKLRPNPQTKPRSPLMIGKIALQRLTLDSYCAEMERTNAGEILVPAAIWANRDQGGIYLSIELSSVFQNGDEAQSMNIEEFLRELEKEQRRKSGGSSE
jgi:hypothetical protein